MYEIRGGEISYIPRRRSEHEPADAGGRSGRRATERTSWIWKKGCFFGRSGAFEEVQSSAGREHGKSISTYFQRWYASEGYGCNGISAGAQIVLADEPTKGLDERRIALVTETLNLLKTETLLCVTHDMNFAGTISEKICVMYAAQQVEYGDAQEVLQNPLHPYTRDMIAAMPENGMKYEDGGFAPSHGSYLNCDSGCRYRARCREQKECCRKTPPLADINGHKVRCWNYVDRDEKTDEKI